MYYNVAPRPQPPVWVKDPWWAEEVPPLNFETWRFLTARTLMDRTLDEYRALSQYAERLISDALARFARLHVYPHATYRVACDRARFLALFSPVPLTASQIAKAVGLTASVARDAIERYYPRLALVAYGDAEHMAVRERVAKWPGNAIIWWPNHVDLGLRFQAYREGRWEGAYATFAEAERATRERDYDKVP